MNLERVKIQTFFFTGYIMAYQNELHNEYDTIDDLNGGTRYDDTLDERSNVHTHEEQPAEIRRYEHLKRPPKSLQIMEPERAPPPKSCCRLPPCWGWFIIIIGISLLCVMVALLVVLLPRFNNSSGLLRQHHTPISLVLHALSVSWVL